VTDGLLLDALARDVESSSNIDSYVPYDPATGRPRAEWPSTVLESAAVLRDARVGIFIENTGAFSRGRETLLSASAQALAGSIQGYTFEVLGIGAAIQSMWIAAVAHGLSGVFMGDVVIAETAIKRRLGIERDLVGVLALGYVDQVQETQVQSLFELDSTQVHWVNIPD
jgi:nitroreductase